MIALQDFLDIKGKIDNTNYICAKSIEPNPSFKALKVFTIKVYDINNSRTEPIIIESFSGTIASNDTENIWSKLEKEVIWKMLCK